MTEHEVVYILAGTYQQATDAARTLPRDQRWRYVYEPRQLHGVRGGTYTVVGTFWERRDAHELYDLARAVGLVPADPDALGGSRHGVES